MATYTKISEMTAATVLGGTEQIPAVQSSAPVYLTPTQIKTYVNPPAGITNTVTITGEYQFTEDNELDYSASITDGMAAGAVTFTELPATTVAILAFVSLGETSTGPTLSWKRTTGGTATFNLREVFADGGTNEVRGTYWMPTGGNSIYVTAVAADITSTFLIIGYKTGA